MHILSCAYVNIKFEKRYNIGIIGPNVCIIWSTFMVIYIYTVYPI